MLVKSDASQRRHFKRAAGRYMHPSNAKPSACNEVMNFSFMKSFENCVAREKRIPVGDSPLLGFLTSSLMGKTFEFLLDS